MNYRDMTAPELVKRWRAIVNDNVSMGRDAHLMKEFLNNCNSVQLLLGIYRYADNKTVTIPMFLRQSGAWLELEEKRAEVELAMCLTGTVPPEYLVWRELQDEQTTTAFHQSHEAWEQLMVWTDRILA